MIAQVLSRRCSFGECLNQWMFCNADRCPGFRSVSGVGRHEEGEAERERFRQADVAYLIKGSGEDVAAYPGIWKRMFYCLTQSAFEWSEFCMEAIANPSSLEGETLCCIDCDDRSREGGGMRADCRTIEAKTRGGLCSISLLFDRLWCCESNPRNVRWFAAVNVRRGIVLLLYMVHFLWDRGKITKKR